MKNNPKKAAVIGCGFVGAATAFTLMQSKLFSELVLLDANHDKAVGEDMAFRLLAKWIFMPVIMMTLPTARLSL